MTAPTPNVRVVQASLGTFIVVFPAMVFIYTMLF